MSVKTCMFCKEDLSVVGRAREHIVPKWLQEEWHLSSKVVQPTHHDEQMQIKSTRKHTYDSLIAGRVCASCNNGWMSELESQSKNLILCLAAGRRHVRSLSHSEALQLARWTVKTAFVLHVSSNWRRVVPENHVYKLDTESYRLPENVFVVAHSFNGSKVFSWMQATNWELRYRGGGFCDDELAVIKAHGYKIALRLGGLFLVVFHNPLPHALTILWKDRHIPLYPRWSHPVLWRYDSRSWTGNAEVRFNIFATFIGLGIETTDRVHRASTFPDSRRNAP
jgi:hypothetical protein